MSLTTELRSQWWGAALAGRSLKHRGRQAYWRGLEQWEKASPAVYRLLQTTYRRFRPAPGSSEPLPPIGSVVDINGIKMRIDAQMTPFQIRKLASGRHTADERELIPPLLEASDTVMELGGGIGMLAIACAQKIGGGRVYSYEANPFLEPVIRKNYALNNVAVNLRMCMLGQQPGTRVLHIAEHFSRSSVFKAEATARPHEVEVKSLNAEIAEIKPTVLIMDIQGGEGELLSFADLDGVRLLLVEMHPDLLGVGKVNALRRRIRAAGLNETRRSGQSFLYQRSRQSSEQA